MSYATPNITNLNRLTVEQAKLLLERHSAKLVHMDYGFDEFNPNGGCAVGLLVLRHTGDKEKVDPIISGAFEGPAGFYCTLSKIIDIPADYIEGLEAGFEFSEVWQRDYIGELAVVSAEGLQGYQDGIALNSLVED